MVIYQQGFHNVQISAIQQDFGHYDQLIIFMINCIWVLSLLSQVPQTIYQLYFTINVFV